ncbi:LPS export ABC transporter permease LptG [Chitinilyticum aquatile]|uniref:LPS export ABC transporter permease LptG n=1 Tax=Chitinilyticum aquatile TaxID=362520 RepID=UPI00041548D1|nr:LPS export ABC transporter permease LptG [Chitinilyticum aquatile]
MMRLAWYLTREVATYIFAALMVLLSLFVFFDLIGELGNIGKGGYSFAAATWYVLLEAPAHVYELLPVSVLIGAVFALSTLAGNSEIVVMRAAGVSLAQFARWLALVGLIFALLTVLIGEVLAPAATAEANRHRMKATKSVLAGNFRSGIWVKDGGQIVNIAAMLPDLSLRDVRILYLGRGTTLDRLLEARAAQYGGDGTWKLSDVRETQFLPDQAGTTLKTMPGAVWKSEVSPDMLAVLMVKPNDMSVMALMRYLDHLDQNKQRTQRYDLALWSKIFYPLACISMILIALPFALLQRRSSNVGVRIFLGILLGVGFNFLNRVVMHVGDLYSLPPMLITLLPSAVLFGLAGWMLWRVERA